MRRLSREAFVLNWRDTLNVRRLNLPKKYFCFYLGFSWDPICNRGKSNKGFAD